MFGKLLLRLALLACVGLAPAACGQLQQSPIDTAHLTGVGWNGVFGLLDPGATSLGEARWAFASAGNLANRPAEAARAVAALDYIAGYANTDPRWVGVDPEAKAELLQARSAVREIIGARPDARSQAVVETMLAAAGALDAGNAAAAQAALSPAVYADPAATLRRLYAMPYVQIANLATAQAAISADLHCPECAG